MAKKKVSVKIPTELAKSLKNIPAVDLNRAVEDLWSKKKVVWDDQDIPINGVTDFSFNDLKELWGYIDSTIRLNSFYDLDVTAKWFDQTLLYQRKFSVDPEYIDAKRHFKTLMDTALSLSLISEEKHKQSKSSPDPQFEYDPEADEATDQDWKFTQFWYIKHITNYLSFAGYSALYRIWEHCGGDTNDLKKTHLQGTYCDAMPYYKKYDVLMTALSEFGVAKNDVLKEVEAVWDWLEGLHGFFRANHNYIERVVASVNVQCATLNDKALVDRADLVRKVNKTDKPSEIDPNVISLWSRYKYLGEEYEVSTRDTINVKPVLQSQRPGLGIGKVDLMRINSWVGRGSYLLKKAKDWRNVFDEIKPKISKPEANIWETRFKQIVVFGYAVEYWGRRLHLIGLPKIKVAKDVEATHVEELRTGVRLLSDWESGEVIANLYILQEEFRNMVDEEDIGKISKSKALRDFMAGIEGTEPPSDPIPEPTVADEESGNPSQDADEVERLTQSLANLDQGYGITQPLLGYFFGVTQNDMDKPKVKITYQLTPENYKLLGARMMNGIIHKEEYEQKPARGSKIITDIFEKENLKLYPKVKPPTSHGLYQKWIQIFDESERREKDGIWRVKTGPSIKGPSAEKTAIFLLEHMPNETRKRMKWQESVLKTEQISDKEQKAT